MNLEMTTALIQERQRELARKAGQWQALHDARAGLGPRPVRRTPGLRLPHYRVSWSRTSMSGVGAAGRRERSWVIVISASRGI